MAKKPIKKAPAQNKLKLILLFSLFVILLMLAFLFDKQIVLFFEQLRMPFVDSAAVLLTSLGFAFLLFGLIEAFIITKSIILKESIRKSLIVLLSFGIALGISNLLKYIIMRPRPDFVSFLAAQLDPSMPSSHAACAFAIAASLYFQNKKNWWIFILAGIYSLLRIYEGVHYMSDIIIGALIGILLSYFVNYSVNILMQPKRH